MRKQALTADHPERAAVLSKAVLAAAQILGLSQAALAKALGLSPASVSRMHTRQYLLDPKGKEWELAALLIRLYRGLDAIMGSDEATVRAWMGNENTDLHAKPLELVGNVAGLVQTVEYVDAFRARI